MKIALLSDLHLDHYSAKAAGLLDHLRTLCLDGDVCVLAGDIADGRFPDQYQELFEGLRKWYSHVIIVTGNHDYYKTSLEGAHHSIALAIANLGDVGSVHHLHRNSVKIGNRTFHGHTMWYRTAPGNDAYEHWMNDIHFIQGLRDFRELENGYWENFVADNVKAGDVVITHHLPSLLSVPPRFKRSETNRFFVCDMELEIKRLKPALWLHGHTHDAVDYILHDTRVVCQPRGYPREKSHGPRGYQPKLIVLD